MRRQGPGGFLGVALLDINILLALLDRDHAHHRRARVWVEREIHQGWASCALTQNGFLRIISQPSYPSPVSPMVAMEKLSGALGGEHHEFWSCDVSLLDPGRIKWTHVLGPRQVTDVYLLALAIERGGRFVTFDRGVPLDAVPGAEECHLVVL